MKGPKQAHSAAETKRLGNLSPADQTQSARVTGRQKSIKEKSHGTFEARTGRKAPKVPQAVNGADRFPAGGLPPRPARGNRVHQIFQIFSCQFGATTEWQNSVGATAGLGSTRIR